ncbi:unnamed protein product [Schistosoma mattheei]|uniref:Uncharacterized protein n=2 Tax=Schistosoma TaxID=6181 RepID=A0A183L7R8_9TREM|nr:unnamed protein product [Schistosoma curassoni]VDP85551.1 unnamed protein product [Schistosoma mattheei]
MGKLTFLPLKNSSSTCRVERSPTIDRAARESHNS